MPELRKPQSKGPKWFLTGSVLRIKQRNSLASHYFAAFSQ
jgi:hypothetical protein